MPPFMLISEYVTYFSKPVATFQDFLKCIDKKSFAYLFPWAIWTIGVRGFLLGGWTIRILFSNLQYLLWHMGSGYWFLTSLWTIQLLWETGSFLCRNVLVNNSLRKAVFTAAITGILSALLILVGLFAGLAFFGIKLTIYYLPFFLLGCVVPYFQNTVCARPYYPTGVRVTACISVISFLILILSNNFYTAEDFVINIVKRIACSLLGCISVCPFTWLLQHRGCDRLRKALLCPGSHTLEVYLCHYLFIGILNGNGTSICRFCGAAVIIANFALTLLLSAAAVILLEFNRYTKLLFFGKWTLAQNEFIQ